MDENTSPDGGEGGTDESDANRPTDQVLSPDATDDEQSPSTAGEEDPEPTDPSGAGSRAGHDGSISRWLDEEVSRSTEPDVGTNEGTEDMTAEAERSSDTETTGDVATEVGGDEAPSVNDQGSTTAESMMPTDDQRRAADEHESSGGSRELDEPSAVASGVGDDGKGRTEGESDDPGGADVSAIEGSTGKPVADGAAGGTQRVDDLPAAGGGDDVERSLDVGLDDVVLDDADGDDQGLFDDLLAGEPIFENKEVLRPSYTPHELPHRSEQINKMATILVSALRGETPSNILIYGKTGTGKTASAKFVSQELESTSDRYEVPCEVDYINCEVTDTQYRVLAQLANKFIEQNEATVEDELAELRDLRSSARDDPTALEDTEFDHVEDVGDRIDELEADLAEMEPVPMTGWPTDRVYNVFFDAVDYTERVVVIMLDEIDKLVEKSGDDTLYNLSRMNSDLENSRVSIMGISNDLKFTDFLDPRVKSSLGEEEIVFPPYDANQLQDILEHRADTAFEAGALTDGVIPLCAAFAAQEHGDARRALDLLRTAGELAEREGASGVDEDHVRKAQDKIELDRVVEVVRTLPTQSKIVLYAIILLENNGVENVNTGEVYNIYKRLCDELETDQLTQRRVTDLISELDMLGIVNAVVVSKGRYGRTKEISLSVPSEETEAVLMSDSRLSDVEDAQPFVQARFDN